jgi:hypothetical protein
MHKRGATLKQRRGLCDLLWRPPEFLSQGARQLIQYFAGSRQLEALVFRCEDELPWNTPVDKAGNVDVGIRSDFEHLAALPLFLADFGNQTGNIRLGKAKLFRTLFAISEKLLPALFPQIPLKRVAHEFARLAVFFLGCRLDFRQQARRDKSFGGNLGFHASNVALPVEESRTQCVQGGIGNGLRASGSPLLAVIAGKLEQVNSLRSRAFCCEGGFIAAPFAAARLLPLRRNPR